MKYEPNELDQMNLSQLATLVTETAQEEELLKLKFEQRARVAPINIVRNVDVRFKWQEDILNQVLADRKSEIPDENPVQLPGRDQSQLDSAYITKEKEIELQAKLDKAKGVVSEPVEEMIQKIPAVPDTATAEPIESTTTNVKKFTKSKKK